MKVKTSKILQFRIVRTKKTGHLILQAQFRDTYKRSLFEILTFRKTKKTTEKFYSFDENITASYIENEKILNSFGCDTLRGLLRDIKYRDNYNTTSKSLSSKLREKLDILNMEIIIPEPEELEVLADIESTIQNLDTVDYMKCLKNKVKKKES